MLFGGNATQDAAAGTSSSKAMIGAGNGGQSVHTNLFCNTVVTMLACIATSDVTSATSNVKLHPTYYYNKRIAFVEPTFTYAAYQNGSFYNFYKKYRLSDINNKTITTDLDLLRNRPIPHGPFPRYYTPNIGFSGTDSLTYKATDGQGVDSNFAIVTIMVNAPPQPLLYDNFEGGTYTLSNGQTSPNKKWIDIYNGVRGAYPSSGVRDDGIGTNNIFFEAPAVSTIQPPPPLIPPLHQTSASLVTSTQKWGNFELDIDVKTVQQLRQNSPPNPWETNTIVSIITHMVSFAHLKI